jgi:hypothetical protein
MASQVFWNQDFDGKVFIARTLFYGGRGYLLPSGKARDRGLFINRAVPAGLGEFCHSTQHSAFGSVLG